MKNIKQIYTAGLYTSSIPYEVHQNIIAAWQWSLRIVRECKAWPVCPHKCGEHMEGAADNEFFYEATLEQMRRCDAVFLMPGWERSKGAVGEKEEAERLGIPVFTDFNKLKEWVLGGSYSDNKKYYPAWIEE